jgi:enoyl-CoA hydratase
MGKTGPGADPDTERGDDMAFETLLVEQDGGLAIVTLNRPRQLNALNRTMVRELDELAGRFEAGFHDARSPRVVIFTGAGDRAFMAGADITEFQRA